MDLENVPDYPSPYKLGKVVDLRKHYYNSDKGGTLEGGAATVTITYAFWDDECGWRYHGIPTTGMRRKAYFHLSDIIT